MNNAKMWLVVNPSVGVPVFLGAVAVGSFAVHVAIVTNTTWVSDFLSGNELGGGEQSAALQLDSSDTAKVAYTRPVDGGQEVTVMMPDGTYARAILQPNDVLASADAVPRIVE